MVSLYHWQGKKWLDSFCGGLYKFEILFSHFKGRDIYLSSGGIANYRLISLHPWFPCTLDLAIMSQLTAMTEYTYGKQLYINYCIVLLPGIAASSVFLSIVATVLGKSL